jgi:diguanylate cyclase (GGDEF)-like protein
VNALFARHNRYLLLIVGLALLALGLVGGGYALTESQRLETEAQWRRAVAMRSLESQLVNAVGTQESALNDFILTGHETDHGRYAESVMEADRLLAAIADFDVLGGRTRDVTGTLADWHTTFANPAIAAVEAHDSASLRYYSANAGLDHLAVDSELRDLAAGIDRDEAALQLRSSELAQELTLATAGGMAALLAAAAVAFVLIRRYGRALERDALSAGIINRFTEVTSFASNDTAVSASNLQAVSLLAHPDGAVTYVISLAGDRATPEAILGDAVVDVMTVEALSACFGIQRGGIYVADDVGAPLSVRCPAYPVTEGTLACLPLSSGELLGVVHLHWKRPHAFELGLRTSVSRVVEHAALTIANRRLVAELRGEANTDARTGLANARAFDRGVDHALASSLPMDKVAVVMFDLDRFKDFNDRYGHPAGDAALRAFAGILRTSVRERDLAVRYGGEEFAVLLPRADEATANAIAERIRSRTEATLVALEGGGVGRISVSAGIAITSAAGLDRQALVGAADRALYEAKQGGRNRVVFNSVSTPPDPMSRAA